MYSRLLSWRRPVLALPALLAIAGCDHSPTEPASIPSLADLARAQGVAALGPTRSPRTLSIVDPVGDNTGHIDVTRTELDFDPVTGDYTVRLVAHPSSPFVGTFRINLNFFNPEAGSLFRDVVNDFVLAAAVPSLELSGTDFRLTQWVEGHRVHTNSLCNFGPDPLFACSTFSIPNPPGTTLFRSSAGGGGTFLTNEDVIAFDDYARPAIVETLTPPLRVSRLATDVEDLVEAGVLSSPRSRGLLNQLSAVTSKLEDGRYRPAINQLRAFIRHVEGLERAGLDRIATGALIERAATIIREIGG